MFGPDVEAAAVMPTMLPAGTAGWFRRATPGNDDATPVSIDFLNHVRGELKSIVEAFGGTENKAAVDQIATALTEYVLTNGRLADSLWIGKILTKYRTKIGAILSAGIDDTPALPSEPYGFIETDGVYVLRGVALGTRASHVVVIDRDGSGSFTDLVVSDDATIDGKVTASSGLTTVAPAAEPASWDSDASAFTGTLNAVGGAINVAADVTNPIPGNGYEDVVITNSKVATTSRIHVTMTYQSAEEPVIITEVESLAGSFRVRLRKLGTGNVTGYVGFHFDVINPV